MVKSDSDSAETNATMPSLEERMPMIVVPQPHPATLAIPKLLQACELRTQRRSGPGGQHRNKTSSGAFLLHNPTNMTAEATERRSQADNREVAVERLRFMLATAIRSPSIFDAVPEEIEADVRKRYSGGIKRMNDSNVDKPAVIALLLNDLHAAGGQPSLVAPMWSSSTSSIVSLVQTIPTAFALVNQIRRHHGRLPLKNKR